MADLTIKVEGSLNPNIEKLSAAAQTGYKQGNISDVKMGQVVEDIKRMQEIAKKGIITDAELKELDSAFKRVAKVVDDAAKRSVKITEEAQKKLDALKKAEDRLSSATKARQDLRSVRAEKITDYGNYAAKLKTEKGISIGNRGKGITKLDTLAGKDIDKLAFFRNGEQVTDGRTINKIKEELKLLVDAYQKTITEETKLNGEIEKATTARAKAEDAYNKQVEADTLAGKTKNTEFGNQVREATGGVHGSIGTMKEDLSIQKEQQAILNSETNLSRLDAAANKTASSLGKVAKQFSIWTIGLRLVRRAMSEVKNTIIDLDKSLTEQAMVTGKTRKEVYGLLASYQNLAIQTGATTKEVSATVTEFIRQGKSTQEALTLAEAAISAAKVASINTADSINYLTTALNGFRLSAQQAMEVSDKFAAVSANAATSYEEIAIALSKVASQANLAGMSIDYTTALLAKGLETTREAPETIGTALKTVIARMREIGDYGETLEDGVDLNNVESQLAYVGIQLRNANGDLRSTEDVLDDLGKKWDSLNSNQQAAIAKALAGTRQQSRLIAMMSDYERVTELQEISARSAGATMAQMGVYTEGLEAALNRLATSWEKIISTISDSDVIIFLVDFVTNVLNGVNKILDNTVGMVAVLTLIAGFGVRIVANKIQEHNMSKLILKEELKKKQAALEAYKTQRKASKDKALEVINTEKETKLKLIQKKIDEGSLTTAEAEAEIAAVNQEAAVKTAAIEDEYARDMATIQQEITKTQMEQNKLTAGTLSNIMMMIPGATAVLGILKAGAGLLKLIGVIRKKNHQEQMQQDAEEAPGQAAEIAAGGAKGGLPGLAIAAGIIAALGLAAGVTAAILGAAGVFKSQEEKDEEKMQGLSNTIYTLTKRSEAIQTAVDKVAELDNKLIKTKKDAEELGDALAQVGDKLSGDKDENLDKSLKNISEQEYYEQLGDREKLEYLEYYQNLVDEELRKADAAMYETLMRSDFSNKTNKLRARSLAKRTGYQALDELNLSSTETTARRTMLESIIDSADNDKLKSMMYDLGTMRNILDKLGSIKTEDGSIASDILQDDDASLKERTQAFRQLEEELKDMPDIWNAISKSYNEFNVFKDWDDDLLNLIEDLKITTDEINDLYSSYDTIKKIAKEKGLKTDLTSIMSEDEYQAALIDTFLPTFESTNMNVTAAMKKAFGNFLIQSEDYEEMYNIILNQIAKTIQVGVQNIGQNVDKLKNSVSSLYETTGKWSTMSNTEKSTFLNEHGELFAGEDGADLLKAFNTQDYEQIQKALQNNRTLIQNIENEKKEILAELAFEEAKIGAERNQATIDFLNERLRELDSKDFFSVDLETLVEQENKRIEAYKDLLQKEQDALTKSLEERKEAYQKYFDAINQSQEDEEYEEKAELLVANLTKLSGSTSADSKSKTEELQNSLAELEKERLDTLRERAQEAVIQNIDDTIDDISTKFDELLANNRELLNMLKGTDGNELVADLLSQESFAGKTANEAQLYLNEIQSTFGSQVSNIDWSNISVSDTGGNLTLNIGDKVIQLTGQEAQGRNIKDAILAALIQNGINVSA